MDDRAGSRAAGIAYCGTRAASALGRHFPILGLSEFFALNLGHLWIELWAPKPIPNGTAFWLGLAPTDWSRQLQVFVRDNNVDQALRILKKKMQREGVFREMKRRRSYEKPSERKTREKSEAVRRARKLARKHAIREGLIPAPPKRDLPGRKPPLPEVPQRRTAD